MNLRHVAIIPDGNRRWAKEKGLAATKGHEQAGRFENLQALLRKAKTLGIEYLSMWVFSTENWKRPEPEKKALFTLLASRVADLEEEAKKENVCIRWLGRRDRVPENIRMALEHVEEATAQHDGLYFQLCLDYGGRDELLRAINTAVKKGETVTEETMGSLLDTHDMPDPDIIIRTSGEQRLSGLFPWQGVYAELFFVQKHFPDFGPEDLQVIVNEYNARQRRFGGN